MLPVHDAANIELKIDKSKLVSVQHLQITKRDDLVHIKSGEEEKRKFYRAHCVLQHSATADIMQKLNIPDGFLIQQKTPLRVLHRRPLLTRPRQIYSVKGYMEKGDIDDHMTYDHFGFGKNLIPILFNHFFQIILEI